MPGRERTRNCRLAGALVTLALGGGLPTGPAAQESGSVEGDPALLLKGQADGIPVGSFLVLPELSVSEMYDSNIFATRDNEVDDTLTILYPDISAKSTWDEHELTFSAGGAFSQYYSNGDEDYDDYWTELEGRYDISPQTNLFGGAGLSYLHEDRSSPDDNLAGEKPTTYHSRTAHAGVSHRLSRVALRLGGTFERLSFDDVSNLDNADRDRDVFGAGARATFELNRRYDVFVQGVWDKRDYDEQPDDNGYRRSSDGYRAGAGVKARFSNRLSGTAEIGKLSQDYDDARFSTVSKPDFGARLSWLASPRTTLSAALERSLEETTLAGASSYLYTALNANLSHRVTSRLGLTATLLTGRENYQGINREDDIYGGQVTLRYALDPRFYVAAGYRVTSRDSNLSNEVGNSANQQEPADYGRSQVFVSLGTLLYPVHEPAFAAGPDRLSLPWADVIWPGFYLGTQAGYDALHVRAEGQRGGGTRRAEYGDRGSEAGVFAGYGLDLGRWYLGMELEGDTSWADLYHSEGRSGGRTLNVKRKQGYGLTARLGYTVPNGVLLYGRGGAVRSKFETSYAVNNQPANAVDETSTQTGIRYGLGADIPATERLFVRLDYSYTDFDTYKADAVTEVEKLEPSENLFRLGLGWRFGGSVDKTVAPAPVERKGFYAGAQLGQGSLDTHLSGTQVDQGPGPFDVVGDFGAQKGVTGGLFAGYGYTWRRWYAGLEAELEMSTAKWKHREGTGGRDFSLDKKDTHGIALRAGYVLNNGTLLYVRGGRVNTRFNTEWVKGGDRDLDIDRDDTKSGTRVGLGAEIPLNRQSFVRLDYSYTDYENYDFVSSHADPDAIEFANTETLFRLALGARF
jgi:opacity protein-like surface antigen